MQSIAKTFGFTLMELMIVISLISILAVIAIPSYQSYMTKARFSEVIASTAPYKIAVTLALQQGMSLKDITNGKSGIPAPPAKTKHLANLEVIKGVIHATATELAGKATYILKPNQDGSIWTVDGTCLKLGLCND